MSNLFFPDLSLSHCVSQVFSPRCPVDCPEKNQSILMITALLSFQNLVSYWHLQCYIWTFFLCPFCVVISVGWCIKKKIVRNACNVSQVLLSTSFSSSRNVTYQGKKRNIFLQKCFLITYVLICYLHLYYFVSNFTIPTLLSPLQCFFLNVMLKMLSLQN